VLLLRAPFLPGDPGRGIRAYCAFRLVVDELHVLNLAVASAERGKGHGRWLLQLALQVGAGRGARRALLEVRRSNEGALALYRSVGFEIVSIRRSYYESPREDALVLEKARLEPAAAAAGSWVAEP
jgi:ribosomal-protein-alanine N-acetyltransferase